MPEPSATSRPAPLSATDTTAGGQLAETGHAPAKPRLNADPPGDPPHPLVSDVVPCVAGARVLRAWAGMTTATGARNRAGFVGEYAREPGFFVLMAGGWGFALRPVLGRLTAELLCDGAPSFPLDEFSAARWADTA